MLTDLLTTPDPIRAVHEFMQARLRHVVPEVELQLKAEVVVEILRLKVEKNALILGHNYMEPALFHTIPDFVGDSLYLSRRAAETDRDIIVFCGVEFMAETAKILNPGKTVLLPSQKAGCSLAASITAQDVIALRAQYPGVPVVTYVNTHADVKAECDVCCTSSNAVKVVESLDSDQVIFIPDEYLARNVAAETGKAIIVAGPDRTPASRTEIEFVGWAGRCEVHEQFTLQDILDVRRQFPDVRVLAHPECSPEVVSASDFVGSTTALSNYVADSDQGRFLMLTECSMADNVLAENPDKDMLRLCSVRCPHMAQITLEDTRDALRLDQFRIEIDEQVRRKAARAVQRMIAIG